MNAVLPALALCVVWVSHAARAEMKGLPDEAMSEMYGQALIEVTQSTLRNRPVPTGSYTGVNVPAAMTDRAGNVIAGDVSYTKLRIGADIQLDAEIGKLRLGGYADPNHPTQLHDISIDQLILTGYQKNGRYQPFQVKNPYIEFAMRDPQDGSGTRELLGVRLGFEEMDGMLGLNINALSGRTLFTSQGVTSPTNGNQAFYVNSYGRRSPGRGDVVTVDGNGNSTTATGVVADAYQKLDALCLGRTGAQGACGDAANPTRDFFIAFNKVNGLFYPKAVGSTEYYPTQQGAWLNLTDNARIYNIRNMTGDLTLLNTSHPSIRRW
ncbi:hypothetical protein [Chitinivorax sp. B]|uniref:hypothetical protein n=1 Tax=Chitinivorax sp. B TaxID=2502235 RepID=UPI0010F64D45|nr:hypothetical protein [Chitinivorax sp. B]